VNTRRLPKIIGARQGRAGIVWDGTRDSWRISFVLAGTTPKAFGAEPSHSVNASEGWKLVTQTKDVAIYSRPHSGSSLKEFKAIGPIDTPTHAVHVVIDDFENYPNFMPYTAECRLVKRESDCLVGYQRLSPRICADRD
jgi:hypothetical protein